ncbi:MAG: ABC transporter permease subunit [Clostridium sp.]
MTRINQFLNMQKRNLLTLFLICVFIFSILNVNWGSELYHSGGKATMTQLIKSLLSPDLSSNIVLLAIESTWITLSYAVAGMSLAIIIALILGILASGIPAKSIYAKRILVTVFRGILGFMRGIHELVWAWLFVASIGLSPFAAIFALAIPYGGALGRIFADILNDVSQKPIKALETSGASRIQVILYGYFPIAFPNMLSYTMYRFECAIRSSTIMSFVGLGGLGYQINLSLNDLNYNEVWTFMFFLIGLVILVDIWSNSLRKRLV